MYSLDKSIIFASNNTANNKTMSRVVSWDRSNKNIANTPIYLRLRRFFQLGLARVNNIGMTRKGERRKTQRQKESEINNTDDYLPIVNVIKQRKRTVPQREREREIDASFMASSALEAMEESLVTTESTNTSALSTLVTVEDALTKIDIDVLQDQNDTIAIASKDNPELFRILTSAFGHQFEKKPSNKEVSVEQTKHKPDDDNDDKECNLSTLTKQRPRLCQQCQMYFVTKEDLESHNTSSDHLQRQFKTLTNRIERLEEENKLTKQLREADNEEDSVFLRDQQLATIIFMDGFFFDRANQSNKVQAKAYLDDLFPLNTFVVTKVRKVCKWAAKYHVNLSSSVDAFKICSEYRRRFPGDNERNILKVTSGQTATRFRILEVIESKLEKRYSVNKPYVGYIKFKPHLFIFKDGAYNQYRFTAAVHKFRHLIDQSDLEQVHQFAFSKNIRGDSLKQYIVL